MESEKIALVVVGMHRSGTSAVTRVLNFLGAEIPKKMLPPRSGNPAGYWESKDLVKLHDSVLEGVNASWDDVRALPNFWTDKELQATYQRKFSEIISREFENSHLVVVKDPRISRFVPLTAKALADSGFNPGFVICVRNPVEVAESLESRDGFCTGKSLLLWLDHTLRAERLTRKYRRSFVFYDQLLQDWGKSLTVVASDLGLTFPGWDSANEAFIGSFLRYDLRHHECPEDDLGQRTDISEWVKVAYACIKRLGTCNRDAEIEKMLDEISREFAHAQGAFESFLVKDTRAPGTGSVGKGDAGSQSIEGDHPERLQVDRLASELSTLRSEMLALRNRYRELAERHEDAEKALSKRGTENKKIRSELESHKSLASLRFAGMAALQKERADLHASAFWRTTKPLREAFSAFARIPDNFRVARGMLYFARRQGLRKARSLNRDRKLLRDSILFDENYYKQTSSDITGSATDPVVHYLIHGASEGRNPHPLFDSAWYLKTYPDVAKAKINPLKHFIMFGAKEKRSPHPLFDVRWYLDTNKDVAESDINPLVHFLIHGCKEGRRPNPDFDCNIHINEHPGILEAGMNPLVHYADELRQNGGGNGDSRDSEDNPMSDAESHSTTDTLPLRRRAEAETERIDISGSGIKNTRFDYKTKPGAQARVANRKTVLLVAHFVGDRLFGAERSFLDILDGLMKNDINIIVALPKDVSDYTREVRERCGEVVIFPYEWWQKDRPVSTDAILKFETLISELKVDLVHVNTIMLREPLIAATNCAVPSIVHVRELILDDKWLARAIGDSPEKVVRQVLSATDWIIANSAATRIAFEKKSSTFVIPNPVDLAELNIPVSVDLERVRIGLISSNIRKKGVEDLVEIARLCEEDVPNAVFVLIGPETKMIKDLRLAQRNGDAPGNIEFAGYAPSPRAGIEKVDIVLNLSHFKESFGRTVLEAMAARRPVIAYDWGALPELVVEGETGFLVPYRKPELVVPIVRDLCGDVQRIFQIGSAARKRAQRGYSKVRFSKRLREAYSTIFDHVDYGTSTAQDLIQSSVISQSQLRENDRLECDISAPDDTFGKTGDGTSKLPLLVKLHAWNGVQHERADGRRVVDVSVVIPNYNYADYLPERLHSILQQTVLPREIIFIDDMSEDESVRVARSILNRSGLQFTIEQNKQNVGPYANWKKGISLARSKFVWIAEADDSCENDFLEALMEPVNKYDDIVISYSQSRKIDGSGKTISSDSLPHTDEICETKWRSNYIELGVREVVDALAYRNTIPNASAAVLKRSVALQVAPVLDEFRYCGDWAFYASLLAHGRISFNCRSLNAFRRHDRSQTRRTFKSPDFIVEVAKVRELICRQFPLRLKQFPRMNKFLNKDYPVDDVQDNSAYPPAASLIEGAAHHARTRKFIAFITTNNGSTTGGSEVLWRETAKVLRATGHDVAVLIKKWEPAPSFFDEFEAKGIKLYFKEDDGLTAILSHAPDLTIISTGDQDEGIEFYGECLKRNLRYVIVNQLTKEERFWPIRTDKQDDVRAGYLSADQLFFTCRNNHKVMEARLSCQLENVDYHFNPFHIDRDAVPPFPDSSRKFRLAVPSKLLYIHKGQDLLIDVLKAEKWRSRPIEINFYGEGDDREKMEAAVRELALESVSFKGRVEDISEIWRDNHALLMPSRMEGLPIMLVSAMLSARVPIVTDIGGHVELIGDQDCGFIASQPEASAIDEAMERAWAVRHQWEAYGARARERVLDFLPDDPVEDFIVKIRCVMERTSARAA